MVSIRNDAKFNAIFVTAIQDAVVYATHQALLSFRRYMKSEIYDAFAPTEYERTNQFYNSWEEEVINSVKGADGKIFQNIEKMAFEPDKMQHGSPLSGDIREYLAQIIFEGSSGNYSYTDEDGVSNVIYSKGTAWGQPRDAWGEFMNDIETKDKILGWFRNSLKKKGIYIRKI